MTIFSFVASLVCLLGAFLAIDNWRDRRRARALDVYAFEPRPDITAFEIATIMRRTLSSPAIVSRKRGDPIPSDVARHFRKLTDDEVRGLV